VNPLALQVKNLSVSMGHGSERQTVVDHVSFSLGAGEILALVGESGCGKTKTAEAIMGLLPSETATVTADAIELRVLNLTAMTEVEMRRIRGREISMVFQEPATALDPVFTIGNQVSSVFRRHRGQSRREALTSSRELLSRVGFADAGRIMRDYPHELSGGMKQRVMVAMAIACRPRVLIADEPTTALDVTTQAQVLAQLIGLGRETGTSILLITHDLGIVAQYCDRALVMYRGKIVEDASVEELFASPRHPHTSQLLAAARGESIHGP